MALLKTLINRFFSTPSTTDTELAGDHFEQLEYVRTHHEWVYVTVSKTENRYQSLILEIDPENKELLIDELYPAENLQSLRPGDTLQVSSQSSQVNLSFYTRLLAKEIRQGEQVYRLEMPEEIGRNQSRGAFRVYVENEVGLEIDINFNGEPLMAVEIINLSSDGIKLSFASELSELLGKQRHFENCHIYLPDGTLVECDIKLRNLYTIHSPHSHSLGGGKLHIRDPQQRVKLQQFLAAVQRRQRRMENRSDSL